MSTDPPQRAVLSHICWYGEHKVVVSQILLDSAHPHGMGWWGRPGCLLQSAGGEAKRILLASHLCLNCLDLDTQDRNSKTKTETVIIKTKTNAKTITLKTTTNTVKILSHLETHIPKSLSGKINIIARWMKFLKPEFQLPCVTSHLNI